MLRCGLSIVVVVAVLGSAAAGRADWNSFWHGVHRDYHRNNMWPEPFNHIDEERVNAPFGPMVVKGWQRQNLVGEHYFDKNSGNLNSAGQLKVRWIVTQVPVEHRTVYIERGATPEATAERVEVVQRAMAASISEGDVPPVVVSNMVFQGWPAEQVDGIGRKYSESAPSPRLPATQASEAK